MTICRNLWKLRRKRKMHNLDKKIKTKVKMIEHIEQDHKKGPEQN